MMIVQRCRLEIINFSFLVFVNIALRDSATRYD